MGLWTSAHVMSESSRNDGQYQAFSHHHPLQVDHSPIVDIRQLLQDVVFH